MTDIESRLRAAMQAMLTEPRPTGILAGVRRRHRRHLARVAAASAVAVLAIAIGAQPAAHALLSSPAQPPSGGSDGRNTPVPAPTAAPGTVLDGCASANVGSIGADWRSVAKRLAGHTLWFISGGSGHASGRPSGLRIDPGIVVISGARPGTTVIVEVAPAGRGWLRFLFGPHDSLAAGTHYRMRSGEDGVTFVGCRHGAGFEPEPRHVTMYYGAFLIRGDRCVPVNVWLPGRRTPIRADLGNCSRRHTRLSLLGPRHRGPA